MISRKKFELPEYKVPSDLARALNNGLEKESVYSYSTSSMVSRLKQLIEKSAVPVTDLEESYKILLSVEQHFENEEISKRKLSGQSIAYVRALDQYKIAVPDLKKDDPFISAGDFVHLHQGFKKHELFIVDVRNGFLYAEPHGSDRYVCKFENFIL